MADGDVGADAGVNDADAVTHVDNLGGTGAGVLEPRVIAPPAHEL